MDSRHYIEGADYVEPPNRVVAWEFGDGQFDFSGRMEVEHVYNNDYSGFPREGGVEVYGGSHGVYSNPPPPELAKAVIDDPVESIAAALPSWLPPSQRVGFRSVLNAKVARGEKFTLALIYRGQFNAQQAPPTSGTITVYYRSSLVTPFIRSGFDWARRHHGETDRPFSGTIPGGYNAAKQWDFSGLSDDQQRAMFLDWAVSSQTQDDTLLSILAVVRNNTGTTLGSAEFALTVSRANDPNILIFEPSSVGRFAGPQKISVQVIFQNVGSAFADKVSITLPIHPALDPASISDISWTKGSLGSQSLSGDTWTVELNNVKLPGLKTPGLLDSTGTIGKLTFSINTRPSAYAGIDSISGQASIVFNSEDLVLTPESFITIEDPEQPGNSYGWLIFIILLLLLLLILWLLWYDNVS
jgi:hypothetical protein